MNKRLKMVLIIGGITVIAAVILTTGIFVVRAMAASGGLSNNGWFGFGMMNRNAAPGTAQTPVPGTNAGGYYGGMTLAPAPRAGVGGYNGGGMMGRNNGGGMMGGTNGGGMMGGYNPGGSANTTPLTVDQAKSAAETYLKGLNNPDLILKEIMVFQNNAYARIIEKSTGVGAMEVLVNPTTLAAFPEYGPDMMWNLKYGPMYNSSTSYGMMGGGYGMTLAPAPRAGVGGANGMMGGVWQNNQGNPPSVSATLPVTPEQAVKAAQQYIDQQFPGSQADPEPDAFYGYYTVDILKDGQPAGMLSVNGYNQQVWYHTWHGSYITGSEY